MCGVAISGTAGRKFLHVTSCKGRKKFFLLTDLVLNLLGNRMRKFHLHSSNHFSAVTVCSPTSIVLVPVAPHPDPYLLSNSLFFCQSLGSNWDLMCFTLPFPNADEVELIFYMLVLYRCLYFFFYKIPIYFLGSFFHLLLIFLLI